MLLLLRPGAPLWAQEGALQGTRLPGVVAGLPVLSQVGLATPASPPALPRFGGLQWLPQGPSGPVRFSVGVPGAEP